jgi:hypothetical protein
VTRRSWIAVTLMVVLFICALVSPIAAVNLAGGDVLESLPGALLILCFVALLGLGAHRFDRHQSRNQQGTGH